ncbi:MAG: dipeptide epimerase [Bacteroidota bacterium]
MKISFASFFLQFRHPFGLSSGVRTGTDSVFVKLEEEGKTGFGEATLPPYLPEKPSSVTEFLKIVKESGISHQLTLEENLGLLHSLSETDFAARCAVECALVHLYSQLENKSVFELMKLPSTGLPECTFTIGVSTPKEMEEKIKEGNDFSVLKLKLDGKNDKQIVTSARTYTRKPLCVDANQGWHSLDYAVEMSHWLKEQNVLLIEQPFSKTDYDLHSRFTTLSSLPVIADESIQDLSGLEKYGDAFSGINIKLLKCGGLSFARQMGEWATKNRKAVLIGCMSESSCGVFHASHLQGYAQWLDLDGPYLIKNDPFSGFTITGGKCERSVLKEKNILNFTEV